MDYQQQMMRQHYDAVVARLERRDPTALVRVIGQERVTVATVLVYYRRMVQELRERVPPCQE